MDKIKILAVDDEEGVLKIIRNLCRNHDIITETDSLKAAELIQKEEFDIFIIDYQMPKLDGIELLKVIQKEYTNKQYVSIFCTAYGTIHLFKEELVRNLFTFFMEKPFNIDVAKEIIKKAIVKLGRMKNNAK